MLEFLKELRSGPFEPTKRDIKECFIYLNQEIFNGEIKPYRRVYWIGKDNPIYGKCHGEIVTKKNKKHTNWTLGIAHTFPSFFIFIITLIHEMVHAYTWLKDGEMTHGVGFFAWEEKIEGLNFSLEKKVGSRWKVMTED